MVVPFLETDCAACHAWGSHDRLHNFLLDNPIFSQYHEREILSFPWAIIVKRTNSGVGYPFRQLP
jgi:hypothetical protein